ncbi:hypothetical protein C1645_798738 [Glomus cerebriforme]|uniref:ATP-grasp domain-containing protein n=1 Tax=Glomus cerebriforme TaxID=658196 RepID=A0A397THY8_9GLOM|nr:hypothetical protein C1645_798738 [Glomus cerebriforme]
MYALKSNNIPIITLVDNPRLSFNMDWVFPDTEEGIDAALAKGAKTLWANTILFDAHPLNYMNLEKILSLLATLHQKCKIPHAILIGNTTCNGAYELNSITLDTLYKNNIRLPAVVKPIRGRRSQGVKKVNTMEQLKEHAKNLLSSGAVIDGQREEITVTVMPPGMYDINFKIKRFNHHDGIAPYSDICSPEKQFALFEINMKPNMTGSGRPGRNMHSSLSCISAHGIGWTYPDLLRATLCQAWPIKKFIKKI